MKRRVVILGAAGRDFHNFNVRYRGAADKYVVAFTAAQIPDIAGRTYPAELAGQRYPEGIPIVPEEQLENPDISPPEEQGKTEGLTRRGSLIHRFIGSGRNSRSTRT